MTKKLAWALVLLGLTVIILILNGGQGEAAVRLVGTVKLTAARSLVYLGFVIVGVAIGVLIK